jgi:hypothetical protein
MTPKIAVINRQYGQFYLSFLNEGTRSRKFWKTPAGAQRHAEGRAYVVCQGPIRDIVPLCCIPGTESYMCM